MKNLIIIAFFALSIACNGQVTVTKPLYSYDPDTHQNGAYYKDLNSELYYWEGTWEGILNNMKYTFVFVKFIQQLNGNTNSNYYYEDEIRGKYQVLDLTTNQLIYDNLSAVNYNDYSILGLAIRNGIYSFKFEDVASKCYNSAKFILQKISGQPNQVKYCYFRYSDYNYIDCPNYPNQISIPMFLPQENLILTKR